MMSRVGYSLLFLLLAAEPAAAAMPEYGVGSIFLEAYAFTKMMFFLLALMGAACLAVSVRACLKQKHSKENLPIFLFVQWAAPVIGLLATAYLVLNLMIAMTTSGTTTPMAVMAPSLAEALLAIICGLLVSFFATCGAFHVRIQSIDPPQADPPG
ncbi:MotA/TolQ/ExbB proton channel family protein [Brevundimonas faecalis]|uniref:Biopolymer transport protein ExbB/TolQ n=1 Tax=Brevundimonas faecalis TaxID=947378 RepID=A0ABV2REE0_9CAUL